MVCMHASVCVCAESIKTMGEPPPAPFFSSHRLIYAITPTICTYLSKLQRNVHNRFHSEIRKTKCVTEKPSGGLLPLTTTPPSSGHERVELRIGGGSVKVEGVGLGFLPGQV